MQTLQELLAASSDGMLACVLLPGGQKIRLYKDGRLEGLDTGGGSILDISWGAMLAYGMTKAKEALRSGAITQAQFDLLTSGNCPTIPGPEDDDYAGPFPFALAETFLLE